MTLEFSKKISENIDYKNKNIDLLKATKTIFNENILFENCIIDKLDFDNIKCKKSITFKRCKFISYFSLKNIKIDSNINFIECESETFIKLFKIDSKSEMFFEYFKSDKKIEFTDLNISKLHINNSTFDNLNIIANLSNDINSLILKNIEILNNIYISKIHNNSILKIIDIKTNSLKFNTINFNQTAIFKITNSNLHFLQLKLLKSNSKIFLQSIDNLIDILQIDKIFLNKTVYENNGGFYNNFIIKKDLADTFVVDFTNVSIDNLEIDNNVYSFIEDDIYKQNNIFIKDNYLQNFNTLKILSKMFADNYQYNLQDLCFYHYKNFEYQEKIKNTTTLLSKIIFNINAFFGRYFLGWGVKLSNIFLSFLYIIILYFFVYNIFLIYEDTSFKFKNIIFQESVFNNFKASFLMLFGSFSDLELINNSILNYVMYSEHLIGILMLSLLTGTIIRKLVR